MLRLCTMGPPALSVAMLATILAGFGISSSLDSLEYEVKAAMLYNFTRFVQWPASAFKTPESPLVVGVWGEDAALYVEAAIRGKDYSGRPIIVKQMRSSSASEDCHVVMLPRSDRRTAQEVLKSASKRPILTISDLEHFARMGGMIGFVTVENRVRFQINNVAASEAGLTVSSKLLSLALNGNQLAGEGR